MFDKPKSVLLRNRIDRRGIRITVHNRDELDSFVENYFAKFIPKLNASDLKYVTCYLEISDPNQNRSEYNANLEFSEINEKNKCIYKIITYSCDEEDNFDIDLGQTFFIEKFNLVKNAPHLWIKEEEPTVEENEIEDDDLLQIAKIINN